MRMFVPIVRAVAVLYLSSFVGAFRPVSYARRCRGTLQQARMIRTSTLYALIQALTIKSGLLKAAGTKPGRAPAV